MNSTIQILNPLFIESGYKFVKTKKTWIKQNDDIIVVCQYQKSKFSNNFFINLGIYFKYGNNSRKKSVLAEECHLTSRYSRIFEDFSADNIKDDIFKNPKELSDELKQTTDKIKEGLLPLLENMLDINYFKNNLSNYPNEDWWLRNITREEFYYILDEMG
ncbi:DUF4304 domain-containing protein [Algibacter sp. 2305UL17-15]|uniref:DUF4304 domain-containing protein n=1 Tax=Algibacter sp. 2305UL17-15 TaxID=3231268 RepID=UPI0034593882